MSIVNKALSLLFALAVLGALGWGAYMLVCYTVGLFGRLDERTSIMIQAALIAVLAGALMAAIVIRSGQRGMVTARLRADKAQAYGRLLASWSGMQGPSSAQLTQDVIAELHLAEQDIMLWASSGVLKQYTAFRETAQRTGTDSPETLLQAEKVVFEMRKDLGLSNLGLREGDLDPLLNS